MLEVRFLSGDSTSDDSRLPESRKLLTDKRWLRPVELKLFSPRLADARETLPIDGEGDGIDMPDPVIELRLPFLRAVDKEGRLPESSGNMPSNPAGSLALGGKLCRPFDLEPPAISPRSS